MDASRCRHTDHDLGRLERLVARRKRQDAIRERLVHGLASLDLAARPHYRL